MRFSIKTMFKLEAESSEFFSVMNPSSFLHPFRCRFTFTANHKKNWSILPKELIIDKVSLMIETSIVVSTKLVLLTEFKFLTNLFPSLLVDRLKMVEFLSEPQIFISLAAEISVKICRMSDISIKPSSLPEWTPTENWFTDHQKCEN